MRGNHLGQNLVRMLEVLDDVKVGQVIAILHGAQARGTVAEAHSTRRIDRTGAVKINIACVEAAYGTRVPVSAEQKSKETTNWAQSPPAISSVVLKTAKARRYAIGLTDGHAVSIFWTFVRETPGNGSCCKMGYS